jgi:hypothetical protein
VATWDEQWRRVCRWYERFESLVGVGVEQTRPIETYEDDVLAFFQNCWHLRDWLWNDHASGVKKPEVNAYIAQSRYLTLCGDLAIGSKHLTITDRHRDPDTKFVAYPSTYDGGRVGGPPKILVDSIYVIKGPSFTVEAFDVATGCMQEWRTFLAGKRLTG